MTAPTSGRGRKRSRREEEETPPRPTLDDLEQEDQAQLTPGRATWHQPQTAGPYRSADLGHPHAEEHQDRATPEQMVRADGAGPQQATESKGQARLSGSATKHEGQSSIKQFLSGAGQSAHAGVLHQQRGASEAQSMGELPQLMAAVPCYFCFIIREHCTWVFGVDYRVGCNEVQRGFVGVQHREICLAEVQRGLFEGALVVLCFGGYQATLCRLIASLFAGAGLDAQASPEGTQESPTRSAPMGTVPPIESTADGHLVHRAPLCNGHQEPCVRKRVNKSGPNKGLLLPATPNKRCCIKCWVIAPVQVKPGILVIALSLLCIGVTCKDCYSHRHLA